MQPDYPAEFGREQGCTEAEWLSWLPGAVRGRPWRQPQAGQAIVDLDGDGRLHLAWRALEPRRIGLVSIPRLTMHYRFEAVDAGARTAFMKYFDLYMQRGGG